MGLTWAELVHAWRDRCGGWTPLAEELARRAGGGVALPDNLETVERGLRRLATKAHGAGGQYGRWLERFFGVPPAIESWLRWLGQYHSRFADLPVSLRRQQLERWDRPPLTDAAAGIWIDLGMASVGFRLEDSAILEARLARVRRKLERAELAARLEHALLRARVHDPDGTWLRVAGDLLEEEGLNAVDALCYRARCLDAEAYRAIRGEGGIDAGVALYEAIPDQTGVPFVAFRRAMGLAYCAHRRSRPEDAMRYIREAAEHAGDGGYVRLRAMAFNLASRIATGPDRERWAARAHALSRQLEDEDLLSRVRKP